MRRAALVAVIAVLAACNGTEQEVAPTTSPSVPVTTSTTMVVPAPSTTTTDENTTTSPPATTTTTTLAPLESLAYEEVAAVEFPIHMVPWGESALIATKDGQVWAFENGEVGGEPLLDISDQVRNDGEQGFLAIAVHPGDESRVFAHYSDNDGDTVVSELAWDGEAFGDEEVIFTHDQPASNHNGGMIQFGPDGALYLGLGDGGRSNDAFGNGQNTETLLAGLVRLDVDGGGEPTLWQAGLRNPWRFWIDVSDELIYIADVGQNAYEEINVAGLEEGLNYGWPITEGLHCFQPSSGCDTDGLTLPVIEVERGDAGTCSTTGGVIYRGEVIPELNGHYFYSDYCGGYLRSFLFQDGEVVEETDWTDQVGVPGGVVSFGMDFFGEMYVLTTDRILKVVPIRAG
jgi:glucose/arabinose dehydrogenase